jgi:RNA polymerase sigma factor (sigma-70 family)
MRRVADTEWEMSSLSSVAVPARTAGPPPRVSHLGDELLARYAARGSDRAFTALYERYHQKLYRYCRSILRDDADAQDALQSAFAGALAALRRDQRNAPLRPWLYKIAHNESISLLRRRSRDAADELRDEDLRVVTSVDQEVADRARWRTLVEDLGGLPDRQRGALLLRELSGLSHEEIAIALGTTAAGAKQAIFEARQALSEIEEGRAMRCEEVRQRISDGDRRVLRGRKVTSHLRECSACDAFAMSIQARRTELRAFTPVLPAAAAAALLSRSLHSASAHGAATGTSAAATAGVAGKATGTALGWKALTGVAVVVTAAAGVTRLAPLIHGSRGSSPATSGAALAHHAASSAGRQSGHAGSTQGAGVHRAAGHLVNAGRAVDKPSTQAAHNARNGKAIGQTGSSHTTGAPGHSGSAPGHQPVSAARGHSGSAPGHQPVSGSHGHSGAAPGHQPTSKVSGNSSSTPGHQSGATSSGHSGSAPGQVPVSTDSGHSGSAPGQVPVSTGSGHNGSAPGQLPGATSSGHSGSALGHL